MYANKIEEAYWALRNQVSETGTRKVAGQAAGKCRNVGSGEGAVSAAFIAYGSVLYISAAKRFTPRQSSQASDYRSTTI